MFQSSLELSPECNGLGGGLDHLEDVSILTRAFARVQPTRAGCFIRQQAEFQSSLELSPECNVQVGTRVLLGFEFQSSLELSPECNARWMPVAVSP